MPLPLTFATLTNPQQLSDFDTQFAAVAALGAIPCTATGTNTIALVPFANTPTISSYPDLQPSFVFVAQATCTAGPTINVNAVGARPAFKWNGLTTCGAGDIVANGIYRATPLQALNAGAGGFVIDTVGAVVGVGTVNVPAPALSSVQYVIDGGGIAITTGNKGHIDVPFPATVVAWRIIADQVGSIVVDILRANAAVPTTSMIGTGNKPTLTAAQLDPGQLVSGWTSTALVANDFLAFNVTSAGTVTRVTVIIILAKL